MRIRPIDLDLLEQRERHAMIDLTGLLHDVIAERLLVPELVAGKPQHDKPLILIILVKTLQTFELRRETALRRGIDDKDDLSAVIAHADLAALWRIGAQLIKFTCHDGSVLKNKGKMPRSAITKPRSPGALMMVCNR